MIIDRDLMKYIVFTEDSIIHALKKISENKTRAIFVVTESGIIDGIVTDGDFRRWLTEQKEIDLEKPVSRVANKTFISARIGDDERKIASFFSDGVQHVPLLDAQGRLAGIALRSAPGQIKVGDILIDEVSPSFIIAEIGNNHNGSLSLAKELIDLAKESGANCAKFQMRNMKSLYQNSGNPDDHSEDLGSQYTLDLLSRFQLSNEALFEAFDYCRKINIIPMCTPWDLPSFQCLDSYGMLAFKVASADLTNHDLLTAIARTGKPMFCSTGMSTETEIRESVSLLKLLGANYVMLHCNSTYPTPFKDVNLSYLPRLKELSGRLIGYSGHERGINVSIAAVAMGAKVIEKHFTIDRNMEGNDHKVSLLPSEFKAMVEGIREVEASMGTLSERTVTQGELMNRENLAKSLVASHSIEAGQLIAHHMIEVRAPGKGLQPNRRAELVGKKAKRNIPEGEFFYPSDLENETAEPRPYQFRRPWGLPVRYHDFASLSAKTNPTLVEFHHSYKDLELSPEKFFKGPTQLEFVVHCPELFAGDHILDLCSPDTEYRNRSILEFKKVIDSTVALKKFFKTKRPQIVTNVGGFTRDRPMTIQERKPYYERLRASLAALQSTEVELIIQTMPPFPWHFGGQCYHNLFVDPHEIRSFCLETGSRICLDISHSKLACNHFGWDFREFLKNVAPLTAHLHIVDARGVDGEGLQIGEGDIDFNTLRDDLEKYSPTASFIPEIWQGHKNGGEGFWVALNRLEAWF